jgi:uncharacterized protein YaaN involved in tellurite resistance
MFMNQNKQEANPFAVAAQVKDQLPQSKIDEILAQMGVPPVKEEPLPEPYVKKTEKDVAKEQGLVPIGGDVSALKKGIDPAVKALAENADPALVGKAKGFVSGVITAGDRKAQRTAVDTLALSTQQQAARYSAMLREPVKALYKNKDTKGIGDDLTALRQSMQALDPIKFGLKVSDLQTALVHSEIGKRIDAYFSKSQSMQGAIEAIVASLQKGAAQLQRDNDIYSDDQEAMRTATFKLKEAIQVVGLIDKEFEQRLLSGEITDAEAQRFVRQELLFPVRQRQMSLQQTLLANQQAIMTSEILINTNRELLRATNDAINISVVQLGIVLALIVGLNHQRQQLDKIQGLNRTTERFMEIGSEILETQAVEVYKMATNCMISLDVIEKCFGRIKSAFDQIDSFRDNALEPMKESIGRMEKLIDNNDAEMKKHVRGKEARVALSID